MPLQTVVLLNEGISFSHQEHKLIVTTHHQDPATLTTTTASDIQTSTTIAPSSTQAARTTTTTLTTTTTTTATTTTATQDPNNDSEDGPSSDSSSTTMANVPPNSNSSATTQIPPSLLPPDLPPNPPGKTSLAPKPPPSDAQSQSSLGKNSVDLGVVFYSVFIVYVSFVKLVYHNIHFIKHNLTEQGILMIFGILWQLVARKISLDHQTFPRFNSRIFFYLFLPSTVLESASLLSNKWLFFNMLPILTHSIIGTLLYASSLGFTIYSLGRFNVFTLNWIGSGGLASNSQVIPLANKLAATSLESTMLPLSNRIEAQNSQHHDFSNLTLSDCLIFGTILSSIDSAPMLSVFKQYHVNEKLYYLVLGENLMNNAVVITIFDSLIDLFEATRLTVYQVYFATLIFFANLVGAVFIGIGLALFALISVRLTKRFQIPSVLSSYQNQCQAMVETLLILKLAYLTYTLANLAGTSSIVGLATFGILNDQYIKHNLNLRSQLAFRQVILGMKTMGFSLVYPLLGMLLVDTALGGIISSEASAGGVNAALLPPVGSGGGVGGKQPKSASFETQFVVSNTPAQLMTWNSSHHPALAFLSAAGAALDAEGRQGPSATKKLPYGNRDQLQTTDEWNFKFLSIVILLTIVYRFLIVVSLGLIGNVLTCGQLKIKFKEQILMAYGGFKGPLSIALVHSLMEHDLHKETIARNKHLFKYTILFNIFISAVLAGTFIRPLVNLLIRQMQSALIGPASSSLKDQSREEVSTIVFEQINHNLTEQVSHGLNSILGRTRSPYDKFSEFNETHIKPWLVRGGSNTNWLSVFYDNLVLDETLNANCFYIASEDPTTIRTSMNETRHKRQLRLRMDGHGDGSSSSGNGTKWTNMWRRRTSNVSFLDTIQEAHPSFVTTTKPKRGSESFPNLVNRSRHASQTKPQSNGSVPKPPRPNQNEVLKEFVMFNLKLENARRRRQTNRRRVAPRAEQPKLHARLIDDDSSNLTDSSLDRASRRAHLSELEANLSRRVGLGVPAAAQVHPLQLAVSATAPKKPSEVRETNTAATFDLDLAAGPSSTSSQPVIFAQEVPPHTTLPIEPLNRRSRATRGPHNHRRPKR